MSRPICLIALVILSISQVAIAANYVSTFQGPHGVYAWNESITGSMVEEQFQLVPKTKICGKIYYLKDSDTAKDAYCYVNTSNSLVCYDTDKDCMANTTWVTGADSDDDTVLLSSTALTITGKVCTKNYWRLKPEDDIQSLYCYNATAGIQCFDDKKECLTKNNSTIRMAQVNLEQIKGVDNQVCTSNFYSKKSGGDSEKAYCWASTVGQQCWIDKAKCLTDVEMQLKPTNRTVDAWSLNPMKWFSSSSDSQGVVPKNNGNALWGSKGFASVINPNAGAGQQSPGFFSGMMGGNSNQNQNQSQGMLGGLLGGNSNQNQNQSQGMFGGMFGGNSNQNQNQGGMLSGLMGGDNGNQGIKQRLKTEGYKSMFGDTIGGLIGKTGFNKNKRELRKKLVKAIALIESDMA